MGTTSDRSIQATIVCNAEEISKKHSLVKAEKQHAKELLEEFKFMKGITTLEAFQAKIQTCEFWGETWAISTLERVLGVKFILLSREAYLEGDLDNVLQCGQLNDTILEEKGSFEPKYYIIMDYQGWHYELITYKGRGALTFKELPYNIKKLVVDKCLERAAGPYYIIPDFRNFMDKLKVVVSDAVIETKPGLYDDSTIFQFYSNSSDKPKPGKGAGETLGSESSKDYVELAIIPNWRKKLSNSWKKEFELDGKKWLTVEHYYQGAKFKTHNPEFYAQFSLDSKSDLSKNPEEAKIAGGKDKNDLRSENITIDEDFFDGRNKEVMEKAMKAKFTQNPELATLLKATKNAKLIQYKPGAPGLTLNNLMTIRNELLAK